MRTIILLSLAVTTALVSSAASAANGQDPFQRRLPRVQQGFAPAIKQTGNPINTFVRPPVQTIANPIKPVQTFQAQLPITPRINPSFTAPIKVDFKPQQQFQVQLPPKPVVTQQQFQIQLPPKPVVTQAQFQVQLPPKPVVQALPIKLDLPVTQQTRQIVPEGVDAAPAKPAPTLQAALAPDATAALQAEIPADPPKVDQPAAPVTTDKPADAQALIQGDAPAAPKLEAQVVPQPQKIVPIRPRKKLVRYYQSVDPSYGQQGYGYQPRYRYSYDSGYGNGYGGDNCQ
jgi:hypothetical protein